MTPHIDTWMPLYDRRAVYSTLIHGPPQDVYAVARHADFSGSRITRILFSLRSFDFPFSRKKESLNASRDGLLKNGFILLEENPPSEIVLGLVGKFWTASGSIQPMSAMEFCAFEQAGFAKGVWNFLLTAQPDGMTMLSTETRIRCTDEASRRKFLRYWFFIGPFSGLIRKEMLRTMRRQIETIRSGS